MPAKSPGCDHQFADRPTCSPAYRNTYECPCGTTWDDDWSCACDDECPACQTTISPSQSRVVAPCACAYLTK